MKTRKKARKTTVGAIDPDVLAFTVGADPELDLALVAADCIGTAAHVTMLSRMPVKPRLFGAAARARVVSALVGIMGRAAKGKFAITAADQDVHLAVERVLTKRLGALGKKVHTGRSRNDQVAVDLRLYGKEQLFGTLDEVAALGNALLRQAKKHARVPMVGRTHMQPAMPSSVGLWAAAHAESLLDDAALLIDAYELNDRCPLGSAASYGVPLPLDPALTARLLDFSGPHDTVLYANNARGKIESVILQALSQVMLSLSRLAQDVILFTMPEFGYFLLPAEYCTGSSIMPQKRNPDVLELVRAKASTVLACATAAVEIVKGQPSGYNRDLQEIKGQFMQGVSVTRASLRILTRLIEGLQVDRKALRAGFAPEVFATDRALELVAQGVPFRDAYGQVKKELGELAEKDPARAVAAKRYPGAPGGLDFAAMAKRLKSVSRFVSEERRSYSAAVSKLLGVTYSVAD